MKDFNDWSKINNHYKIPEKYVKILRFYGYRRQQVYAFLIAIEATLKWIYFFIFYALAIKNHTHFQIFLFAFFCVDIMFKFCFWLTYKLMFKYKPLHLINYSEKYLFLIPINSWEKNDIKNIFQKISSKESAAINQQIESFSQNLKFNGLLSEYLEDIAVIKKIEFWSIIKLCFRIIFTLIIVSALIVFIWLIKSYLIGAKLIILVVFSIYFCYFLLNYLIKSIKNILRVDFLKKRVIYLKGLLLIYENKFLLKSDFWNKKEIKEKTEKFITLKQYILFDIKEIREILFQNFFIMILVKKILLKPKNFSPKI